MNAAPRISLEDKYRQAEGEIYLTDLVAIAAGQGGVGALHVHADEVAGVNTRAQLAALEAAARAEPLRFRI